jgi:hypothetical protein
MFRTPRVNVIESDEGFSIEVLGRTGILYTEGPKTMLIDSEVLASPGGIAIIKKSIRAWNPPYEKEIIDDMKRITIIDNVRRAFHSQGEDISVM